VDAAVPRLQVSHVGPDVLLRLKSLPRYLLYQFLRVSHRAFTNSAINHFSDFGGAPFYPEGERNAVPNVPLIGGHRVYVLGGYVSRSAPLVQRSFENVDAGTDVSHGQITIDVPV